MSDQYLPISKPNSWCPAYMTNFTKLLNSLPDPVVFMSDTCSQQFSVEKKNLRSILENINKENPQNGFLLGGNIAIFGDETKIKISEKIPSVDINFIYDDKCKSFYLNGSGNEKGTPLYHKFNPKK